MLLLVLGSSTGETAIYDTFVNKTKKKLGDFGGEGPFFLILTPSLVWFRRTVRVQRKAPNGLSTVGSQTRFVGRR